MIQLLQADARHIPLKSESVHAVVTSPPYYALRDYKTNGQLGLEKRADCLGWATGQPCGECYICRMVEVFQEVRRVLRKDGVCFLNIGDSYANSPAGNTTWGNNVGSNIRYQNEHIHQSERKQFDVKPKDMLLIPSRLALALQASGWWVRSDIIWAKPNPMPESVTDRPTKSHEYIWLLAKSKDYFWDQEAVKEDNIYPDDNRKLRQDRCNKSMPTIQINGMRPGSATYPTRNLRTVWNIATQPYSGAHYATYPEELVLRCLKAATSERGVCPKCGKQWIRELEKHQIANDTRWSDKGGRRIADINNTSETSVFRTGTWNLANTIGWQPSCSCGYDSIPATIFDPFCGSGTTLLVAKRMGLSAIGCDLSYQYLNENARERIELHQEMLL